MISEKLQEAFNNQINAELYSSYLYLSMAAYFDSTSLPGFARWMRSQAQEEVVHAMKFFHFINERGGRVKLTGIDGPPTEWKSPLAAFEAAYAHEQKVSGMINELVDLAIELRDHAANNFLQWFVSEQVEEEASADEVVNKIKLAGERGGGLFMVDRELGSRVFTLPATDQE
jgi:ferritin